MIIILNSLWPKISLYSRVNVLRLQRFLFLSKNKSLLNQIFFGHRAPYLPLVNKQALFTYLITFINHLSRLKEVIYSNCILHNYWILDVHADVHVHYIIWLIFKKNKFWLLIRHIKFSNSKKKSEKKFVAFEKHKQLTCIKRTQTQTRCMTAKWRCIGLYAPIISGSMFCSLQEWQWNGGVTVHVQQLDR